MNTRRQQHRFLLGAAAGCLLVSTACGQSLPERIRQTDVRGGVLVHVGCGDGQVTAALPSTERFIVRGLDTDPAAVREAARHVHHLGMSAAARTSFQVWDGQTLPFADNLVNILVVSDAARLTRPEMLRVVAPLGFLLLRGDNGWQRERKPWPDGMGEWPHADHGADGNPVTQDRLVEPAGSLRWIAGPLWLKHHNHTPNFSTMVSARGRLFTIIDDTAPGTFGLAEDWQLIARDAFNGTVLWQRPVGAWGWPAWGRGPSGGSRFDQPVDLLRRLVAWGDSVYVALGTDAPVTRLDAATGKTRHTYADSEGVSEILLHNGLLILSVHQSPGHGELLTKGIRVYDADTGQLVWRRDSLAGVTTKIKTLAKYTSLFVAAGENELFVIDGNDVACLELRDGTDRWRRPRPPRVDKPEGYSKSMLVNQCMLVAHDDMLLLNQIEHAKHTAWLQATPSLLVAYSAKTGEELWQAECGMWDYDSRGTFFVIDGLVWVHAEGRFELLGIDPKTGKVVKTHSTKEAMTTQHHHRCYSNKATANFILTARRGIEYLDIRSGENNPNHWVRGVCRYGIMPANGLTYAPPDPCMCYASAKVNGMVALGGFEEAGPSGERLTRGAAYGEGRVPNAERRTSNAERGTSNVERGTPNAERGTPNAEKALATGEQLLPASDDWPMYRHDPQRSGSGGAMPAGLEVHWRRDLGGELSGVTVADGRVFVSAVTTRTLYALDAVTGEVLWHTALPSPADTPPTLHAGMAFVGSADGHVYALRAADGALCWRFRVAPGTRQITAFGRLESAWPVHGSVLIRNGTLYASAGRSSFLDNGINLCALDPLTGELLREHAIYTPNPQTGKTTYDPLLRYDMPMDQPGALSDIFVSHGQALYMRHVQIDPATLTPLFKTEITAAEHQQFIRAQGGKINRPGPQLASNAGLLDSSYFNQTFWTHGNSSHSRMLVFDDSHTFSVRAYGGKPHRHARSRFSVGTGKYTLLAQKTGDPKVAWQTTVPIRAQAMVGGDDRLLLAGAPPVQPGATAAELGGAEAGIIWVVGKSDGTPLSELTLTASPVWDGMALADARVYAALKDGAVVCLTEGEAVAPPRAANAPARRARRKGATQSGKRTQAVPATPVSSPNLALRKPVTCSFPGTHTHGTAEQVVDGETGSHFGYGHAGWAWIQVDLGAPAELTHLKVWHYFRDKRTYNGNCIALSLTGKFEGEETVVFDSDRDGAYQETQAGKTFTFKPVRARYIRNWLNGNTSNDTSQWVEIQAFARQ